MILFAPERRELEETERQFIEDTDKMGRKAPPSGNGKGNSLG